MKVMCTELCVKRKQRSKYISRGFRKEEKLLVYEDDVRQIDSQHSDFAGLTEF